MNKPICRGIQRDIVREVRMGVAARIPGFNGDKLLISCTHTHNAPNFRTDSFPPPPPGAMTPAEYRPFFIERTVETAVRAWKARSPGQVTPARGTAVVGWCRRLVLADGTGLMYCDSQRDDFVGIEGPMDPGIELLLTHALEHQDRPRGWRPAGGTLTGMPQRALCPVTAVRPVFFTRSMNMISRNDLLPEGAPAGMEIFQLTAGPLPGAHIYMEAQIFTPDSTRFLLHEYAGAHGRAHGYVYGAGGPMLRDPRHRYLLCDLTGNGSMCPMTDEPGISAPCVSPDGKHLYYFVDGYSSPRSGGRGSIPPRSGHASPVRTAPGRRGRISIPSSHRTAKRPSSTPTNREPCTPTWCADWTD